MSKIRVIFTFEWFHTYFSSGGGGISCVDGHLGGVFSHSIIANGAAGSGIGLTVFVSICNICSTLFTIYFDCTKRSFAAFIFQCQVTIQSPPFD